MLVSKQNDTENQDSSNTLTPRHNLSFVAVQKEDWEQILEEKTIIDFRKKDLALGLFYSSYLTTKDYLNLLHIFSEGPNSVMPNPQEPSAYYADLIDRDVGRTYQQIPYFKDKENQNKIRNLLQGYADIDQEVGYAQGMNFIAGTLVYFQVPEKQKIFNEIISKHRTNYIRGTPGLFQNLARLKFKLKSSIPRLYKHFNDIGLRDLGICFTPYYLTLMLQSTPFQYQMLILNIYLLMGEQYITKLLIAMLKLTKNTLLKMKDFEKVSKFIRNDLVVTFFEQIVICRKEQRLIQLLFNIGLIKRKE